MKFMGVDKRSYSKTLKPHYVVIIFGLYSKLKYACHCDTWYVET